MFSDGLSLLWSIATITATCASGCLVYLVACRWSPRWRRTCAWGALVATAAATVLSRTPIPTWLEISLSAAPAGAGHFAAQHNNGMPSRSTAVEAPYFGPPAPVVAAVIPWADSLTPGGSTAHGRLALSAGLLIQTLLAVLAVIVVFGVCRMLAAWLACWRLVRSACPIHDRRVDEVIEQMRVKLKIAAATVSVCESSQIESPLTLGLGRAWILLPAAWQSWDRQDLESVLAHELAHVQQRDAAYALAANAVLACHYYHPLVHWIVRRFRLELEFGADAVAAQAVVSPAAYIDSLLKLAEAGSAGAAPAFAAADSETLLVRMRTLAERFETQRDAANRQPPSRFQRWTALALLIATGALAAGVRPTVRPREPAIDVPAQANALPTAAALIPAEQPDPCYLPPSLLPDDSTLVLSARPQLLGLSLPEQRFITEMLGAGPLVNDPTGIGRVIISARRDDEQASVPLFDVYALKFLPDANPDWEPRFAKFGFELRSQRENVKVYAGPFGHTDLEVLDDRTLLVRPVAETATSNASNGPPRPAADWHPAWNEFSSASILAIADASRYLGFLRNIAGESSDRELVEQLASPGMWTDLKRMTLAIAPSAVSVGQSTRITLVFDFKPSAERPRPDAEQVRAEAQRLFLRRKEWPGVVDHPDPIHRGRLTAMLDQVSGNMTAEATPQGVRLESSIDFAASQLLDAMLRVIRLSRLSQVAPAPPAAASLDSGEAAGDAEG